jgi:predicted acyl esterase
LLDYARHGPDDPLWSERAIAGESIIVPALCVGGWRDSFADGLVEAYQSIRGPKRLVIGPWGHLLPQDSAHAPIDFLTMALRWWQEWLCVADPGIPPQPPVLLSIDDSCWRGYAAWPPAETSIQLVADGDTLVSALVPRQADPRRPVGRYTPDPTIGTLRGLPGLGLGESCPPQDQHDDDLRSVCATGAPLPDDLIVGGRPEVVVRLDTPVPRLAVRLNSVDPDGRSTLVSSGVVRPDLNATENRVLLRPVHHRVPAGHRLRIAISDADFPRLTPLATPVEFMVSGLSVTVPVLFLEMGIEVRPPAPNAIPAAGPNPIMWTIARQPADNAVEVSVDTDTSAVLSRDGHRYRVRTNLLATVRADDPESARCEGTQSAEIDLDSGQRITATAAVRCTQDAVWACGEVTVDGMTIVAQTWQDTLTRE